ncbi:hypothetical protein [Paenibacillus xylanexedens]|uniref:hypothetical protein n=1 Tax=Paenibacillus xylanexedens TaxID=528191 RepID=UPI0011AACB48|nr:hypothetical protein [Paenibacillus xylanexedens]
MFRQLDHLLSAETSVDSWYDDGCVIATEILEDFRSEDWNLLSREVLGKPIDWQKKLAYCLDSTQDTRELEVLLSLISVDDTELIEICIDTLRSYTSPEHKKRIINHPLVIERANSALSGAGNATKKIIEDFLRNITV